MNSKTTLSITEARKNIFDIAQEVQKPGTYYTLTENGKPKAVILSFEEFDSLMENLELLSDTDAMERIKKAEQEFETGDYYSWDQIKNELGWKKAEPAMVMEKAKRKYNPKLKNKK
jgi:prevent-host-death family protein